LIPGFIIALITFPGIIVHEMAHEFFCRVTGVIVYEVKYLDLFSNRAGYVLHSRVRRYGQAFWICIGPLVFNAVIGSIVAFPSVLAVFELSIPFHKLRFVDIILLWLGVSIAIHAFPSKTDINNLVQYSKEAVSSGNYFGWIGYAVSAPLFLVDLGSSFGLNIVLGAVIIYILPYAFVIAIGYCVK
jgi:hypothetical protein